MQRQISAYAAGERKTARAVIMRPVVAGLSDDEIDAVARCYELLVRLVEP